MKYTVITGASSGIGYASAVKFAQRDTNLILTARREERLEALKKYINTEYPDVDCKIYRTDLSCAEECYAFYNKLKSYAIKTWINNAGIGVYGEIGEHDTSEIQSMLHLNVEALTILSNLYAHDYKNIPGTQLINISSAGGYTVVQNAVTYCATKFYVSAFTEGLALELKNQNAELKAKVLAPFLTATEFAKVANNVEEFSYDNTYQKYHTSEEMADFLLQLYDSNQIVGSVSREDFTFTLGGVRCIHGTPSK